MFNRPITEPAASATGQTTPRVKKNVLILITPTIVDAQGKELHNDEDLPQRVTTVPKQPEKRAQ